MSSDIGSWLESLGLGQYTAAFVENDIDPDILTDLSDNDLKELGVSLGHRKRITRAVISNSSVTSQKADIVGAERRQLTIMFCDLVDSTPLSVRFDPEDLSAIIRSFQKCCERIVGEYGGSVARYMGDGILVYFGYPRAGEHDPERAIRSGMEIVRAVRAIDAWPGLTLQTRIGIATGPVVVGDLIGEGNSREHAVVGETPNLAARLQSLAKPDSVVVSSSTRKLAGGLFEYHSLGLNSLKGFEKPVEAWRVDHELDLESRFDAKHLVANISPILGRRAEIALLRKCQQKAFNGESCAAILIGEAGIGKSRLSHALRERINNSTYQLISYFCLPFRQNSPLYPVIAHLERIAGFERDDDIDAKLDKLDLLVEGFTNKVRDVVPLFASLLGISSTPRYAPLDISPQLQRTQTISALGKHLASFAKKKPVIVVFEDLHWADPTTLELLKNFIRTCTNLPVFFLFSARPEFQWQESPDEKVEEIHLGRLGESLVRNLVIQVAGNKSIPDQVVKQIVDKTDGVPLFVEELTKTVLESKFLIEREDRFDLNGALPEFAVPDTLQDSLMARLDRMSGGKKIAQLGAAIGRSFSFELISAASGLGDELLEPALQELTDSELVHQDGVPPQALYVFKHALIQDAAYSSMLRANRLKIHNQIAESLELYFPESHDKQPQMLALHYARAHKPVKAIPLWQRAAKRAIERGNNEEALKNIEFAIKSLQELPYGTQRSEFELELCVSRGVALESTRGYAAPAVEETYARASELCKELDSAFEFVPVLLGLYVYHFVRGDLEMALDLAQRCVRLSKKAKRLDGLIESNAALGFVLCYRGEFEESRRTLNRCIRLYETREGGKEFSPITAQDPAVASYSVLAILLWILGDTESSLKHLDSAFLLADRLRRPINRAVVHTHAAELFQLRGESEVALDHAQKGLQISTNHGDVYWGTLCSMHKDIARSSLGDAGERITETRETLNSLHSAGARTNTPYFLMRIAEAERDIGCIDQAIHTVEEAIKYAKTKNEGMFTSPLNNLKGELVLATIQPRQEVAEQCFLRAIEIAKSQVAPIFELRASIGYCRMVRSKNSGQEQSKRLDDLLRRLSDRADPKDVRAAKEILN